MVVFCDMSKAWITGKPPHRVTIDHFPIGRVLVYGIPKMGGCLLSCPSKSTPIWCLKGVSLWFLVTYYHRTWSHWRKEPCLVRWVASVVKMIPSVAPKQNAGVRCASILAHLSGVRSPERRMRAACVSAPCCTRFGLCLVSRKKSTAGQSLGFVHLDPQNSRKRKLKIVGQRHPRIRASEALTPG